MKRLKILFATVPLDGHFNPLTGLAVHLKNQGHDVRWYTGKVYREKLKKLDIPYYPFKKALEVSQETMEDVFPERRKHKGMIAKLKYDIKHFFLLRSTEYYEDIKQIGDEFPFDLVIVDIGFTAIPFIKDILLKPVISIGIVPIMENSKDLPPNGLGLEPESSFWGKRKQGFLRFLTGQLIFKDITKFTNKLFREYGIVPVEGNVFDILYKKSTFTLQIGIPGFEYSRSDLSKNIRYIGRLPVHIKPKQELFVFDENWKKYEKIILVTQGTVEKDPEKIIVPTLKAFKNSNFLVIATTGGSGTAALRKRFPQKNIVIEDFIPFNEIMPYADAYVSNGGYGGVMLSIENKLPLVVAGMLEAKNEVNSRVGYFKLGVNLKTEKPTENQIREGVYEVLTNPVYKESMEKMNAEFTSFDSFSLCEKYIWEALGERNNKGSIATMPTSTL